MKKSVKYTSIWEQYKDEAPFAITVIIILAASIGVVAYLGDKDYNKNYKPHEQYLIGHYGETSKIKKITKRRQADYSKVYYRYSVDKQLFECYFESYEPDTIQIGDKCKIWYSTEDSRFHKVNSLQNEVEKAKAISSEN